jgi:long-subunit fatty acid transport protein
MLPTVSADVALDLADPEGVNALDVNVGYNLSPLVGVVVQPVDALTLGAVWHGENHSPLDLPVDVDAGGIDLNAWVTAVTYFVPHRVSLGAEWRFLDRLAAEVDATWYHYSGFEAGAPEVSLYDSTGKDPLNVRNADPGFSDTVSPAVALHYSGPLEATLSYRWAPSPVPEQTAESNLLCGDTHTVASGFRVLLTESQQTPRRLFLDAALFYSYMPRQRDFKDSPMPGNPGYPSLEFGGHRVGIGVGMEVEY